jgi:hypothetical protein
MHDAFDFTRHEETLKCLTPKSKQAEILSLMLQDVCSCSDFIQSYTKDSRFCTSFSPTSLDQFERAIFSDTDVEEYRQRSGG